MPKRNKKNGLSTDVAVHVCEESTQAEIFWTCWVCNRTLVFDFVALLVFGKDLFNVSPVSTKILFFTLLRFIKTPFFCTKHLLRHFFLLPAGSH